MSRKRTEREVIAVLAKKIGDIGDKYLYDDEDRLVHLYLERLNLSHLPSELGKLKNLYELSLYNNQLTQLSPEIGKLTNLQELSLHENQLTHLPAEIGKLTHLKYLSLHENQLTQLPPEIGQLKNLQELIVEENPDLLTPPPEIAIRGTASMLDFFQELQKDGIVRCEAKLLVVGEGGTGKTSLLRSLRNEDFDPHLSTTHGIEITGGLLTWGFALLTLLLRVDDKRLRQTRANLISFFPSREIPKSTNHRYSGSRKS